MKTSVHILIKGYLSNESDGRTCPTIALVQDGDLNIIVDPGTAKSPELIIRTLKQHGLEPKDINLIFLTHSHYDHFKNIALFPNASCRDYWGLWDNDKNHEAPEQLSPNIKIIKTPGHSYDGLTMLVNTDQGVIAICGDLYFKEYFPKTDPYASNAQALEKSREKIQQLADFIIPGHGAQFTVNK